MPEGIVLIVENDPQRVEADLAGGVVGCPACGGRLARWSFARRRTLRGEAGPVVVRPRRGRCCSCGKTQVLVPDVALGRRVDTVAVIGRALGTAAAGVGHRVVAGRVARPVSTVRGWLRRFRLVAARVAVHFTVWAHALGPEPGGGGPGRFGPGRCGGGDRGGGSGGVAAAGATTGVVVGVGPVGRGVVVQHQHALAGALSGGHPASGSRPAGGREPLRRRRLRWVIEPPRWRCSATRLIREAADPAISKAQRGRLVRDLAAGVHTGPDGVEVRVGRSTVDQWIRAWRAGGFEALKPAPRALSARVPREIFELAEALKRESAGPHRRPYLPDRGRHPWVGPARTDHPTPFPPDRDDPTLAERRQGGVRTVRGDPDQRAVGRRRPARPDRRASQGDPVRVHGRPLPAVHRVSVGDRRGHRARRGGPAGRSGLAGGARGGVLGQRQPVRVGPAAAGLRQLRDPPDPLPARTARGPGQDRTGVPHRARPVPRRGRPHRPSTTWPGSTSCSRRGSRPSITAPSTPRPAQTPLERFAAGRHACATPPPSSSTRRSCGPRPAPSPRPPR